MQYHSHRDAASPGGDPTDVLWLRGFISCIIRPARPDALLDASLPRNRLFCKSDSAGSSIACSRLATSQRCSRDGGYGLGVLRFSAAEASACSGCPPGTYGNLTGLYRSASCALAACHWMLPGPCSLSESDSGPLRLVPYGSENPCMRG